MKYAEHLRTIYEFVATDDECTFNYDLIDSECGCCCSVALSKYDCFSGLMCKVSVNGVMVMEHTEDWLKSIGESIAFSLIIDIVDAVNQYARKSA